MLVRSAMHQAGAAALTKLLQFAAPAAGQRTIPCGCGQQAHYREVRSKPVLTAVGKVEVSRPYYLCSHCHAGQFPADVELDIENTEFSPGGSGVRCAAASAAPSDPIPGSRPRTPQRQPASSAAAPSSYAASGVHCQLLPAPSCSSRRQRCRSLGCTSKARATSATLCPPLRRRTAVCLNSLVNFLRAFIFQFSPFNDFQGLTGCLNNGVHSTDYFVTQMLRQGDAGLFKRYIQAKLNMMREALARRDR